jgi:predicted small lipoprotein YifL
MKRMLLLILVLLLMIDLAEDGCLGKASAYLPCPSAKTTVKSSHQHPGSGQGDFGHELSTTNVSVRPCHGEAQPVGLHVSPILLIMHCCHLGSSGGIPL